MMQHFYRDIVTSAPVKLVKQNIRKVRILSIYANDSKFSVSFIYRLCISAVVVLYV